MLVIGGGDGGVIREVLKYKSVTNVVLCEIDQVKKAASGFSDALIDIEITPSTSPTTLPPNQRTTTATHYKNSHACAH